MWSDRLQNVYKDFTEFESYAEMYGLHARLGYRTAQAAWDHNPKVQGSVRPEDYKRLRG